MSQLPWKAPSNDCIIKGELYSDPIYPLINVVLMQISFEASNCMRQRSKQIDQGHLMPIINARIGDVRVRCMQYFE